MGLWSCLTLAPELWFLSWAHFLPPNPAFPSTLPHPPRPRPDPGECPQPLTPTHDAQSRSDQGVWSLPSSPAVDGPVCACPCPAHRLPLPRVGKPARPAACHPSTHQRCLPQPLPAPALSLGLPFLLLHFARPSPGRPSPGRPSSSPPGSAPAGPLLRCAGCGQRGGPSLGVDSTPPPAPPASLIPSLFSPDPFRLVFLSAHRGLSSIFKKRKRCQLP